jgi:CDP-diglyceride synthetase
MRPELRDRLLFGLSIAALVLAGLASDLARGSHLAVLVLGLIGAGLGCREFARLARGTAPGVQLWPMLVVCLLLVAEAHLHGRPIVFNQPPGSTPDLIIFAPADFACQMFLCAGLAWVVLAQMRRHGTDHFVANVGATMLGMLYLGVTISLIQGLALIEGAGHPGRGAQLVFLFLAAVKLGDVGAYFGGRAFGRHKMCPQISPGKTWEGFAFSFVGSLAGTYLFVWIFTHACAQQAFDAWWKPAVWALVLNPIGVVGDLVESCMKRDAAVKDSGTAVPGFGGFLDILDALLIAAPAAYLLTLWL